MTSNPLDTVNAIPSFSEWMEQHGKVYALGLPELTYRRKAYEENIEIIKTHNAANHTWTMSATKFADMTADDFTGFHLGGAIGKYNETTNKYTYQANMYNAGAPPPPVSNDWCTPIKNSDCRLSFSATSRITEDGQFKTFVEFDLLSEGTNDCCEKLVNVNSNGDKNYGMNYVMSYIQLASRDV